MCLTSDKRGGVEVSWYTIAMAELNMVATRVW